MRQARQLRVQAPGGLFGLHQLLGGGRARHPGGHRAVVVSVEDGELLAAGDAVVVDHEPPGDGERPGQHLGAADEAAARAVHVQEGLLYDVLDDRAVAHAPAEVTRQPGRQLVVDRLERGVVARRVALHGRVRARRITPLLHRFACNTGADMHWKRTTVGVTRSFSRFRIDAKSSAQRNNQAAGP
jgi:hypothetical protein